MAATASRVALKLQARDRGSSCLPLVGRSPARRWNPGPIWPRPTSRFRQGRRRRRRGRRLHWTRLGPGVHLSRTQQNRAERPRPGAYCFRTPHPRSYVSLGRPMGCVRGLKLLDQQVGQQQLEHGRREVHAARARSRRNTACMVAEVHAGAAASDPHAPGGPCPWPWRSRSPTSWLEGAS
jgi:hypothetical protein